MKRFTPQRKNANRHTPRGLPLLEDSVQRDGWIGAQTAAADGEMIAGTARLELAAEKFADAEPIVIESDGTRPVYRADGHPDRRRPAGEAVECGG